MCVVMKCLRRRQETRGRVATMKPFRLSPRVFKLQTETDPRFMFNYSLISLFYIAVGCIFGFFNCRSDKHPSALSIVYVL